MRMQPLTRVVVAMVTAGMLLSSAPPSSAEPDETEGLCAWSRQGQVIWPETRSIFWMTPLYLVPGMELVVRGTYPDVRYTSLKTYNGRKIVESLSDEQITAEKGSKNPFLEPRARKDGKPGTYTVKVRPDASAEEGDNLLAGFLEGADRGWMFLNYRIYVPDDPGTVTGGPLPDVTIRMFGGLLRWTLPECPGAVPESYPAFASGDVPGADLPPGSEPATSTVASGALGPSEVTPIVFDRNHTTLWDNPDDAYLVGTADARPGQVAVVRAKAPEFPDKREGELVTDDNDVRYWSLCVHLRDQAKSTADCSADFETALDDSGYYTFVISMPEDRPTNAGPAQDVTWMHWGQPTVGVALTLRNILPDPGFDEAIQKVLEPGTAAAVMGEYYPVAGMCPRAVYEAGGPEACLPPA